MTQHSSKTLTSSQSSSSSSTPTSSITRTQSPSPTDTAIPSSTFTASETQTFSELLSYFRQMVMGLSKEELDKVFGSDAIKERPLFIKILKPDDAITVDAIKAAAQLINESANQELVEIVTKINPLDKRSHFLSHLIDKRLYGVRDLQGLLSYFTGSQASPVTLEFFAMEKCEAESPTIENQEYLNCVTEATRNMMYLFGLDNLNFKKGPNKMNNILDFIQPKDLSQLNNLPELSVMCYSQKCKVKLEDGKLQLPLLDKRFVERIKERAAEPQKFEYVRGLTAGVIQTASYVLIKNVIKISLLAPCANSLWQKCRIEKNQYNLNLVADGITFACSFAAASVVLGVIPAVANEATKFVARQGCTVLKKELDKKYKHSYLTDFILDYMLPYVITSGAIGISNLNVKTFNNATLNALGYFTGSSFMNSMASFCCSYFDGKRMTPTSRSIEEIIVDIPLDPPGLQDTAPINLQPAAQEVAANAHIIEMEILPNSVTSNSITSSNNDPNLMHEIDVPNQVPHHAADSNPYQLQEKAVSSSSPDNNLISNNPISSNFGTNHDSEASSSNQVKNPLESRKTRPNDNVGKGKNPERDLKPIEFSSILSPANLEQKSSR